MTINPRGFIGRECRLNTLPNKSISLNLLQNIYVELDKTIHTTIIAKSGGGKSYLLRVLAEEELLAKVYTPIIFDPLGVFQTIKTANNLHYREWNIQPQTMENVEILSPGGTIENTRPFHLTANQISPATFSYAFGLDTLEPQSNLYRKSWRSCFEQNPLFSYSDLRKSILISDFGYKQQTVEAVLSKLDSLGELNILGRNGLELDQIVRPHRGLIFDFSDSGSFESRIFINFIAENLLSKRKRINRILKNLISEDREDEIPGYIPPISLYLDEAHEYLPGNHYLRQIIKEGRNIGIKLTAVSQSVDLQDDLYANSSYFFVGALTLDKDISKIAGLVPLCANTRSLKVQLKSLIPGCFLFFNALKKNEEAKLIRIRPSLTAHIANTEISDEKRYVKNYNVDEFDIETKSDDQILEFEEDFKEFNNQSFSMIREEPLTGLYNIVTPSIKGVAEVYECKQLKIEELPISFLRSVTNAETKDEAIAKFKEQFDFDENSEFYMSKLNWKTKEVVG